jgi:predicted outer membrane repeat protein
LVRLRPAALMVVAVCPVNANGETEPYNNGAGIYVPDLDSNRQLALANCVILNNSASAFGGAVYSSLITATNCTLVNN